MKTYRSNSTGLFVGRMADQVEGEEYETVEVPTNPKEALIEFLNEIQGQAQPQVETTTEEKVESEPFEPSEESKFYASVAEGRVKLDEMIWNAPLDITMRVASIVWERTREHFKKMDI